MSPDISVGPLNPDASGPLSLLRRFSSFFSFFAFFSRFRFSPLRSLLETIAAAMFGQPTRVEIVEPRADAPPPPGARPPAGRDPDALRQLRADALNDPGIGRALEILGAEIVEIRPLSSGGPGQG